MRPNHTSWPAAREAARRLLREDAVQLVVPEAFLARANELVDTIREGNPARLQLPHVSVGLNPCLMLNGALLVAWEGTPDLSTLLLSDAGPSAVSLDDVLHLAMELAAAGYPGCLGCGGPGIEDPWNEEDWRRRD